MTYEEAQLRFSRAAAVVKLICGVANNAAWLVMLDGYGHAKRCRRYGQSAKGGKVGTFFKRAINEFHDYERGLLRASTNRMFHLSDMAESTRRKYGDITDDEYYEFWKGIGGVAYIKTKPLITSLQNKYRLSLVCHHIDEADHIAWVMTAQAAIDLSIAMYDSAIIECMNGFNLPKRSLETVFGQFSLRRVSTVWRKGLMLIAPDTEFIDLDDVESKNIDHGLQQLMEAWMKPDLLYSSTSENIEDFEEIFATKGFWKMALRDIAEIRAETLKELQKG